jgi:hypothetical protein
MKIPKIFLLLLGALLASGAMTPPRAHAQVSVNFFYDSLDPYGEWVSDPDYGYCWHPTNVDENWAPYTDGYWAYTDGGWTWVSYEDYGGVVYHYGRWTRLPGEGWVWVPGYTWAPAWVSWRVSDDYVGWAPLPPEARWSAGIGFSTWVDARFDIGPGFYSFVGVHDFGAPALGAVIVNREQNINIINNTTNITNITVNNSNVYTGGPSYAKYSALSSRPIPALKLSRQSATGAGGKIMSRQQGSQLMVIAPKISAPAGGALPAPPKVAKTISGVKADHGWDIVKDPDARQKLQAQIKDQASTAGNASAKPVSPDDVKLVSDKIKTGGATPRTAAAEEATTPKPGKSKTGKSKNTDISALENAPATEEPGTAAADATPKKGKSKKSKTPSEYDSANGDETPVPRKSKKSKTPSEYDSSADETPVKHSKKSSDENLQPFMSGGDEGESKPKKSSEDYEKNEDKDSGKESEKSYEGRSPESGYPAGEAGTPKGAKKSKKAKDEEQGYPPVPGQ